MRLLFLFMITVAPAAWAGTPPVHEEARPVMGTVGTVQAWAPTPALGEAAVDRAFAAFARVDSLMSTWRDDSALAALNGAAPGQWVDVGGEVVEVLDTALAIAEASDGAFDPTILPLMYLWGFRGGTPAKPDSAALDTCLERVDYRALETDADRGRARLARTGMAVDLGGIAKGYALDGAARAMREAGATGGSLDLGGNILVFGEGPSSQVGVLGPEGGRVLATLPVVDTTVATSGQYENHREWDGQAYGHILDPRTGWPVPGGVSVTVLADRGVVADALATAAVVLGPEKGLRLLESQAGVEGVILLRSKTGPVDFLFTSGLDDSP